MKITLTGITKSFGEKKVILTTSLTIESGSFTTLLGPSGCGKTTLLRMIAGLETPDTGEICFDDRVVFSSERKINVPPEKRGLGFVFQDFALWPHMSVFENVAFGLRAAHNTKNLDDKVRTRSMRCSWTSSLQDFRTSFQVVSSALHSRGLSLSNRSAFCLTSRCRRLTHFCVKKCVWN